MRHDRGLPGAPTDLRLPARGTVIVYDPSKGIDDESRTTIRKVLASIGVWLNPIVTDDELIAAYHANRARAVEAGLLRIVASEPGASGVWL